MSDFDDDEPPPSPARPFRRPIIERPIYLSGAEPPSLATVVEACKKSAPLAGLIGATLLGAVAAYFVPKALDAALPGLRARFEEGDDEGEENAEFEGPP